MFPLTDQQAGRTAHTRAARPSQQGAGTLKPPSNGRLALPYHASHGQCQGAAAQASACESSVECSHVAADSSHRAHNSTGFGRFEWVV